MPPDPARRLIVRAPNWLGDAVMSTAFLRALRKGLPGAEITVAGRPYVLPVYDRLPYADRLLPLAAGRGTAGLFADARLLRKEGPFDAGILLPNSFASAILFFMAGVPRRIGYRRNARSLLLSDGPRPEREGRRIRPVPMVDVYARLLPFLGVEPDGPQTEIRHGPEDAAALDEALRGTPLDPAEYPFPPEAGIPDSLAPSSQSKIENRKSKIALLAPGAAYGPSKLWREDRFARVGDRLVAEGWRVAFVGGPADAEVSARVAALMEKPPANLTGKIALGPFKALVRRADLVVTTDSGPRHFAVACGKPVVVLMGPTDPRYTDCNLEKTIVLRKEVPCGPCQLKVCPLDHRCMELIGVEEVIDAVRRLVPTALFLAPELEG